DHTNVLPVSPTEAVAAFETGKGFFKGFSGGKAAWEAVKDAIALPGASPADFVEVYSIRGQRLPALALFDPNGSLFGTADAYLSATPGSSYVSVLRFPRVYNSQTLYNLSGLAAGPSQPIVFGNKPSKRDVSISACPQLVQLVGLRVLPNIIAYTRADTTPKGVVQIHDAATAGQDCGKSTKLVAASAPGAAAISRPALEAGDQV